MQLFSACFRTRVRSVLAPTQLVAAPRGAWQRRPQPSPPKSPGCSRAPWVCRGTSKTSRRTPVILYHVLLSPSFESRQCVLVGNPFGAQLRVGCVGFERHVRGSRTAGSCLSPARTWLIMRFTSSIGLLRPALARAATTRVAVLACVDIWRPQAGPCLILCDKHSAYGVGDAKVRTPAQRTFVATPRWKGNVIGAAESPPRSPPGMLPDHLELRLSSPSGVISVKPCLERRSPC